MRSRVTLLSLCLSAAVLLPAAALTLSTSEAANAAPIAENLTLTTYKNVAVQGQCAAVDPEGDLVTFQLAEKPARGQVELNESGAFCYTPYENKKGRDTFTYVAVDTCGNVSDAATVKVTIEKQSTKVCYSDMDGDRAHYAALRLAEEGVFTGACTGGVYCFQPDSEVTRGEFLAMAMTAAGVEALEGVTATGFSDDGDIPTWAKGYVSAALLEGTVRGTAGSNGQAVFRAEDPVTAAEAAVIIDRLLAMGNVSADEAGEECLVPGWAYQSVMNMAAVDVVSADADMGGSLSRGEAAEMLSAMLDVLEGREASGWIW